MNYNIYRISRDKWNKIVNNHSRQHHNPPSGNQIYMGRKPRRRGSSVKLWRQQSEKRNASENKPNIYTSIQCVVSRGVTLGKLGVLKWSQTNKWFRVDSFMTQIIPVYHHQLPFRATSCLTKLISTTVFKQFHLQSYKAGPEHQKKRLPDFGTDLKLFSTTGIKGAYWAATFPPMVDWSRWADALSGRG